MVQPQSLTNFESLKTASLVAQRLKRLPAMRETWVRSLGREDPLEKEMATHSSILAWRIPWTEEPGEPQSTGSQRVGHDWATSLSLPCGGGGGNEIWEEKRREARLFPRHTGETANSLGPDGRGKLQETSRHSSRCCAHVEKGGDSSLLRAGESISAIYQCRGKTKSLLGYSRPKLIEMGLTCESWIQCLYLERSVHISLVFKNCVHSGRTMVFFVATVWNGEPTGNTK